MVVRRRCAVCGSKQWHKEPSSGLIACSEGHILQNYRNETNEAEDVGNHMMRKRSLKLNRKKKERQSKANPKLYHGTRGRYLYFQCQQLILRKQIYALITLWNLPKEFEMVCRDLWALHLSLLQDPPPSEPTFDSRTMRSSTPNSALDEVQPEVQRSYSRSRAKSRKHSLGTRPSSPLPPDSSSSSSSTEQDEDSEMDELMREISESEEDDNDELDEDSQSQMRGKVGGKSKRGHNAYEGPANNLAVLIVACWTLRIPVMYSDIIRHIELYELPYLDPVRLLPMEMVSHLTKHNVQALSPAHAPKILTLHARTSRLAKQLYISYKISTPEANTAPLLWRIIQGMSGTPTLYAMTKRLSHRLSLPLVLHQSLAPKIPKFQSRDPQTHDLDNAPVEASLLAAVIVVLKMVYGFDGERRSPKDNDDPAFALPCIEDYLFLVRQMIDVNTRREAIFNSEKPIFMDSADDEMLDEYLAFCEKILLRPGEDQWREHERMLASYFPPSLGPSIAKNPITGECSPSASAPLRRGPPVQGPSNIFMTPGEKYTIFHSRDVFGSVPEEYGMLVKRGSNLVGIPEDYIDSLVEKYERRNVWKKLEI
ncbi:hypothetical protein J3R30DRAFT_3289949 [Lentinula aciculospora]|uniref:RRN7-type domain-containing protein n=1 Tax=Lentinula aciculospora TaxID=153920 RepID=A0A9W9AAC5_9AGAR|nr:hypothetical protein J3R30DRAFT_3289949 [Lentinula aciculospora]